MIVYARFDTSGLIIRELRALQRSGFITPLHCLRAERYVERHAEVFRNAIHLTVAQVADVAVGYTSFAV